MTALRCFTTTPLTAEFGPAGIDSVRAAIEEALDDPYSDPAQTPILWYLAMRAALRYQNRRGRYPGTPLNMPAHELDADTDAVWSELLALSAQYFPNSNMPCAELEGCLKREHAAEVSRLGACELHNIASLGGGVAAQEAVKILTHQYIPLDNTYVYNGLSGNATTYKM